MTNAKQTPMSHWLISGAALIWNLLGLKIYVDTVSATTEDLAQIYNDEEVRFIESVPVWATSAHAIAVTAAVIGCLLLLFRRSLALPLFIVSLVALIVQDIHSFVLNDVTAVFGMIPAYIQGTVLAVAIALIFYTRRLSQRGLLR